MAFVDVVEKEIRREAGKLAERYQAYHNGLYLSHQRDVERIDQAPARVVQKPAYWSENRLFNPFYVLKHSKPIARSIARKLQAGDYVPHAPVIRCVPKPTGAPRSVSVYQIPDAAVSHLFYERLLEKNRHRLSAFAYAYRRDKNVQFAIQDIAVDLRYYSRLFIAEVDFSDFFGSIEHEYLFAQLHQNGFLISAEDETVIRSFLTAHGPRGIPQGTSISLFLANLVCWRLDKRLESIGLKFARYADDSVIWSPDYGKICQAFEAINEFSSDAGVAVNARKSEGISLLTRQGLRSEFGQTKHFFSFLGYKIAVDRVSIGEKAVLKIKKQISYLLYRNLIQPLRATPLRALVIPANNEDKGFLVALSQVRRYLYGNLSEEYLAGYLRGVHTSISFKGIMSFYPLVDDEEQLRKLDGWLVGAIHRTLRKRARLLQGHGYNRNDQFPFHVRRNDLVPSCGAVVINGKRLLTIPSFLRIFRAIRKGVVASGIESAMNPHSGAYEYND
jgi:hypothetical protein